MSGTLILVLFVAGLLIAARLFLRPEQLPPIPEDDERDGRVQRADSSRNDTRRPTSSE